MPTVLDAHFKLPSSCQIDVTAHHVEHQTIERPQAARHLECIDQFNRAGNIHVDGISAGRPEPKVETKPFGAMPREFNEALDPERAFEDETRVFVSHRRLVQFCLRASNGSEVAAVPALKKASQLDASCTENDQLTFGVTAPWQYLGFCF
jgi:hypothetical protein